MSKWISGFLPNKNGNYLITTIIRFLSTKTTHQSYVRLEFDSIKKEWKDKEGNIVNCNALGDNFITYWWDEYGITENKKKRKLNFRPNE